MISKFIRSRFCSLKKFRAIESVMTTIYSHNDHIKEMFPLDQKQYINWKIKKHNLKAQPRLVLSDRIKSVLAKMEKEKKISHQESLELLDMINPQKGIKLIQFQSQPRFRQGINQAKLFPIHPNSNIAKFMMRRLYEAYQINGQKKYIKNRETGALRSLYIVGTSGIGKSSTIYMIKLFHDRRIKHVIKQGCQKDSLFEKNIKIFYFHSETNSLQIMKKMIQQIKDDFGQLPNELKKDELFGIQFNIFIKKIVLIYQKKDVQTLLVVDQINALYKGNQNNQQYIKNWQTIKMNFTRPIILISSKNNEFLDPKSDPVLLISSTGDQDLKKYNIDDYISTEARLCYVAQCLLFQLQKKNIPRDTAIHIVRETNNIPLVSHLAIRKIVKSIEYLPKAQDPQTMSKIINDLRNKLQYNQDIDRMIKNITQIQSEADKISNGQILQKEKLKKSLDIILSLFNIVLKTPSIKKNQAKIIIQNERNQQIKLQRSFESYFRKMKEQILPQQYHQSQFKNHLNNLSNKNFFYIDYFSINNQQSDESSVVSNKQQQKQSPMTNKKKQVQQKVLQYLCFNLSSKDFERLRQQVMKFINYNLFQRYKLQFPNLLKDFVQKTEGEIFQSLVGSKLDLSKKNNIYLTINFMNKQKINYTNNLRHFDQKLNFKSSKQKQDIFDFNQIAKNYVNFILNQKSSSYCRIIQGGRSFDFIISTFFEKRLKLFFIDTTITSKFSNKIKNFYSFLLQNENLKFIIEQIKDNKVVLEVQIYFYILHPYSKIKYKQNSGKKESEYQIKQDLIKKELPQPKKDGSLKEKSILYIKNLSQKISIIDNDEGSLTREFQIFFQKINKKDQKLDIEVESEFEAFRSLKQKV